jgi:uncharacterized protein YggT (Ycf19 family)
MALIDLILNLCALLLWLSWRSHRFDPLHRAAPATLAGTLKRAQPSRRHGWQMPLALLLLLIGRAAIYWGIGAPAGWNGKLDLGLVVLTFRSDVPATAALFSLLSFLQVLVVVYFWLAVLATLNEPAGDTEPISKLIRLHLGVLMRWPWWLRLGLLLMLTAGLWLALHPLLAHLDVTTQTRSFSHLLGQGLLIAAGLVVSLKLVLPLFLFLHLIVTYVYLGRSPLWEFISLTARRLLAPLRWLPLRAGKFDFAPLAGVFLIYVLLHWLPALLLRQLDARQLTLWPQ